MDVSVNCMACLVADESRMEVGATVTIGVVTHTLAKAVSGWLYPLCAYDNNGILKPGMYYRARVYEENVVRSSPADQEPDARGPLDSSDP